MAPAHSALRAGFLSAVLWRVGPGPWLALAGLLIHGCASTSLPLSAGGFAAGDGGRLSLAVAQARAQFPELSAQGLAHEARDGGESQIAPELVLQGDGVGFSRGLQLEERSKAALQLYLDKTSYARGYAAVRLEGREKQTWPIVAYELRGKASGRFEYSYLLAGPEGSLRYLVILGGGYSRDGVERLAFEGILLIPAPGKPLDEWARAYKFDFGFTFPARPDYQAGVAEAEALFRELQRDVLALERLSEREEQVRAEAASARGAGGTGPTQLEARAADLREQIRRLAAETEAKALRYYQVRTAVDNAYAAFVLTTPYTWRDVEGQSEYYRRWQQVEFHHPVIDDLVARLASRLADPDRLRKTRAEAMALFARNNNWDKDPARKAAPGGAPGAPASR